MQAPKSDIFVALLGIALAAIVIACLLMLWLTGYNFEVNAKLALSGRSDNPSDLGMLRRIHAPWFEVSDNPKPSCQNRPPPSDIHSLVPTEVFLLNHSLYG